MRLAVSVPVNSVSRIKRNDGPRRAPRAGLLSKSPAWRRCGPSSSRRRRSSGDGCRLCVVAPFPNACRLGCFGATSFRMALSRRDGALLAFGDRMGSIRPPAKMRAARAGSRAGWSRHGAARKQRTPSRRHRDPEVGPVAAKPVGSAEQPSLRTSLGMRDAVGCSKRNEDARVRVETEGTVVPFDEGDRQTYGRLVLAQRMRGL